MADVVATPAPDVLPPLSGLRVLVAGAGTAGNSAALFLAAHDARVTVCDGRVHDRPALSEAGIEVVSTDDAAALMSRIDLLVVSPGFRPDSAVVTAARAVDLPVWGEVELAWRVDRSGLLGAPRTWLVITGTNGKTTTTSMVEAVIAESGRSGVACGNIGLPVLDALVSTPRIDVLAVELSSFQLYWAPSVRPDVGVVLNIAEDHLDWHGSMDAYVAAKSIALGGPIAVVGADDPIAGTLRATSAGARTVPIRLGHPARGELGVREGHLVDRAFTTSGDDVGTELAAADTIRPAGPSGVTDALAAAALCLGAGIDVDAIRRGLEGFRPGRHRGEVVATLDGIDFVDDSKATNPHAALASIRAHRRVVLVAGGLLKGASVDEMIVESRDRLAAVVLIGTDRDLLAGTIARHAPSIPTVTLFTGDDGRVIATPVFEDAVARAARSAAPSDPAGSVMHAAVAVAWQLASSERDRPDAVLLAPAAASLDMYPGYGARGDAFTAGALAVGAVRAIGDDESTAR